MLHLKIVYISTANMSGQTCIIQTCQSMSMQCVQLSSYSLQASKEVLDEATAQLWWAGKELTRDKSLGDFIGKNEKTKIIAKLQKVSCIDLCKNWYMHSMTQRQYTIWH